MTEPDRHDALRARLRAVRDRLERACVAAGREPGELTLVAVTKTYPAADVVTLAELGVADVGESREPEASNKVDEVDRPSLRWHFLGQIQSRKAAKIARYAFAVHSLDRAEVARRLDSARPSELDPLIVLIQVSLDGDRERGGVLPESVLELAGQVADLPRLTLRGVMAVAPRESDPDVAFAGLREVSDALRAVYPDANWISAGMSGDLEQAVKNGATHVRVGSALLGQRQP